jgi:predicted component of type VI protein secretion system
VSVPSADVDLFRRVAAALAKDDHRAQRLRQAIQNAGSVPITFEEWLAAPGTTKQ